jgi:hypothetical protein
MEGGGIIDDETDPDSNSDIAAIKRTREEPQAIALRENVFSAIRGVVEIWSLDVEVSHVRSPQRSASEVLTSFLLLVYWRPIQIHHLPAFRHHLNLPASGTASRTRVPCCTAAVDCRVVIVSSYSSSATKPTCVFVEPCCRPSTGIDSLCSRNSPSSN